MVYANIIRNLSTWIIDKVKRNFFVSLQHASYVCSTVVIEVIDRKLNEGVLETKSEY